MGWLAASAACAGELHAWTSQDALRPRGPPQRTQTLRTCSAGPAAGGARLRMARPVERLSSCFLKPGSAMSVSRVTRAWQKDRRASAQARVASPRRASRPTNLGFELLIQPSRRCGGSCSHLCWLATRADPGPQGLCLLVQLLLPTVLQQPCELVSRSVARLCCDRVGRRAYNRASAGARRPGPPRPRSPFRATPTTPPPTAAPQTLNASARAAARFGRERNRGSGGRPRALGRGPEALVTTYMERDAAAGPSGAPGGQAGPGPPPAGPRTLPHGPRFKLDMVNYEDPVGLVRLLQAAAPNGASLLPAGAGGAADHARLAGNAQLLHRVHGLLNAADVSNL
jgi:hypothetical protein